MVGSSGPRLALWWRQTGHLTLCVDKVCMVSCGGREMALSCLGRRTPGGLWWRCLLTNKAEALCQLSCAAGGHLAPHIKATIEKCAAKGWGGGVV